MEGSSANALFTALPGCERPFGTGGVTRWRGESTSEVPSYGASRVSSRTSIFQRPSPYGAIRHLDNDASPNSRSIKELARSAVSGIRSLFSKPSSEETTLSNPPPIPVTSLPPVPPPPVIRRPLETPPSVTVPLPTESTDLDGSRRSSVFFDTIETAPSPSPRPVIIAPERLEWRQPPPSEVIKSARPRSTQRRQQSIRKNVCSVLKSIEKDYKQHLTYADFRAANAHKKGILGTELKRLIRAQELAAERRAIDAENSSRAEAENQLDRDYFGADDAGGLPENHSAAESDSVEALEPSNSTSVEKPQPDKSTASTTEPTQLLLGQPRDDSTSAVPSVKSSMQPPATKPPKSDLPPAVTDSSSLSLGQAQPEKTPAATTKQSSSLFGQPDVEKPDSAGVPQQTLGLFSSEKPTTARDSSSALFIQSDKPETAAEQPSDSVTEVTTEKPQLASSIFGQVVSQTEQPPTDGISDQEAEKNCNAPHPMFGAVQETERVAPAENEKPSIFGFVASNADQNTTAENSAVVKETPSIFGNLQTSNNRPSSPLMDASPGLFQTPAPSTTTKPAEPLFGDSKPQGSSLFGITAGEQPAALSSALFTSQAQPNNNTSTKEKPSLFGNLSISSANNIFAAAAEKDQASTPVRSPIPSQLQTGKEQPSGGLFANLLNQQPSVGSMFSNTSQIGNTGQPSTGLFGSSSQSVFGGGDMNATTGALFSQAPAAATPSSLTFSTPAGAAAEPSPFGNLGGGIFGGNSARPNLFGGESAFGNTEASQPGGLFGGATSQSGALFGGDTNGNNIFTQGHMPSSRSKRKMPR